jgi:hypothetical protein
MTRRRFLPVLLVAAGLATAPAQAAETVKLDVAYVPNELGASTTMLIHFKITPAAGSIPTAATDLDLQLPRGMGFAATTLGLETCTAPILEEYGPSGCSPNAVMGYGNAEVVAPFQTDSVYERAQLTAFMGPPSDGHTVILFYADAKTPVVDQIIFPGELLPGSGRFGGHLDTKIPLITTVPGGYDVAVEHVNMSIGPLGLNYVEKVHGRFVRYEPAGMAVPTTCHLGGFPFRATFTFEDGTAASTTARVPCPRAPRHGRR